MRLSYAEIAAYLGLPGGSDDRLLTAAVTDSREASPGALFVCVPGSRVDGHDFAAAAVARGAAAVLAQRPLPSVGAPVLLVPDTVAALGRIAALWRSRTTARVVGVTGTAGKTTLKEVLAQVLAVRGRTARNALNHNNQIGMPRAMLAADGQEDFWVMEAGISHAGDMDALGAVLRPDLGVILNAGAGHTEGLGEKGVAWHKARLLRYLASGGLGLVCADYPDLAREAGAYAAQVRWFSAAGRSADYAAAYLGPAALTDVPCGTAQADRAGELGLFRIRLEGATAAVAAPFRGAYGAENVAAVAAAAHLLGLSLEEIALGLGRAVLPAQRLARLRLGGWQVLDDTYNANPLSMRRMLEATAGQAAGVPLVAVLGEMLELGAQAAPCHEELGRQLAALGPAAVFWKGGQAEAVRAGLVRGGYAGPWLPVTDAADFVAAWERTTAGLPAGVALFKGSRGNRLEVLLAALQERLGRSEAARAQCGA
ncbi:UDP-N-acetylmuramoyl-tripeptide--D-alanyl-D-alanine ligase [Desulfovibrio legallii]|uniref:UDP-N-acetylmuramoyl-tripeptide--D-alanyl-D-alanine ligase n=1 Tax=Desulfovibrio legallii TaxID=571438 RepID=A0A1G7LK56_9BACT|nr:UDP-N-acetylmuramoyl-tripeptide--D-alanyl-D-alanine ligase [Desulfovibrio legallii]SDF49922.1 UDP-N-acetylmuramoyl-tripeptide--D-alanyl-D-alanine ligase [Desulfovibrio legallii]